jgi:hypothetical protein
MALDEDMLKVASMAYIKMGGQRKEEMILCASALLRNPDSYEIIDNERAEYVRTGKFPTKEEETKFKEAIAITSGIMRGTIAPVEADYYYTQSQVNKLQKEKALPETLEKTGRVGRYQTYVNRGEMPVL